MHESLSFKLILLLAIVQGIAVLLVAFNWVQIGADLYGQGLLLLPFLGAVVVMRGLFISIVGLLYLLFVVGAFLGKSWARWVCLTAVIVTLLLVLSALVRGGSVPEGMAWSAVPVLLIFYLFSQTGRDALKGT